MSDLLKDVEVQLDQYLVELEAGQRQMLELMEQKQVCLAAPDPVELLELANREAAAVEELQDLVRRRLAILDQARSLGVSAANLEELALLTSGPNSPQLQTVNRLRFHAGAISRANQSRWVACQKAVLHFRQLVEIIANGGKKPLQAGTGKPQSQGGVILDASV